MTSLIGILFLANAPPQCIYRENLLFLLSLHFARVYKPFFLILSNSLFMSLIVTAGLLYVCILLEQMYLKKKEQNCT